MRRVFERDSRSWARFAFLLALSWASFGALASGTRALGQEASEEAAAPADAEAAEEPTPTEPAVIAANTAWMLTASALFLSQSQSLAADTGN